MTLSSDWQAILRQRQRRGSCLLTARIPDWRARVSRPDLRDASECVLAQLSGYRSYIRGREQMRLDQHQAVLCGFALETAAVGAWQFLQELWDRDIADGHPQPPDTGYVTDPALEPSWKTAAIIA